MWYYESVIPQCAKLHSPEVWERDKERHHHQPPWGNSFPLTFQPLSRLYFSFTLIVYLLVVCHANSLLYTHTHSQNVQKVMRHNCETMQFKIILIIWTSLFAGKRCIALTVPVPEMLGTNGYRLDKQARVWRIHDFRISGLSAATLLKHCRLSRLLPCVLAGQACEHTQGIWQNKKNKHQQSQTTNLVLFLQLCMSFVRLYTFVVLATGLPSLSSCRTSFVVSTNL